MINANEDKQHERDHKVTELLKKELSYLEYYEGQLYDSIRVPHIVILFQKILDGKK